MTRLPCQTTKLVRGMSLILQTCRQVSSLPHAEGPAAPPSPRAPPPLAGARFLHARKKLDGSGPEEVSCAQRRLLPCSYWREGSRTLEISPSLGSEESHAWPQTRTYFKWNYRCKTTGITFIGLQWVWVISWSADKIWGCSGAMYLI